ncbi:FAD-dependent oxidoreductase [Paraburkholderia solisilvae]|uniref:Flavin-dependent monooxygenase n=1 Tax=Paraburkholderia solisilvae TaxID=624376 RepID=A0A6J5DKW9_9BURK|nr:NAD(P)/FAD-dependent oxidoreductase [Paraburkholderia solisilvae]CAB3754104.1 Flavin-dependent monooxygenase [Paraburkholderia solisilvae]
MNRKPLRVAIIGAGTGGLCLAHALHRQGIDVNVFERDRSRFDAPPGYRIGIDGIGMKALRECLPEHVLDFFNAACARTPRYLTYMTERLQETLGVDVGDVGVGRSTTRLMLRQVMMCGLEDRIHFGKSFARYTELADRTVTAHFADGSVVQADLIVGADGANSKVRSQLLPYARIENTGILGVAGTTPLNDHTRKLLSPKMLSGITLLLAPKGFGAVVHVLAFDKPRDVYAQWPGMRYVDRRDVITWAVWGAASNWPANPLKQDTGHIELVLDATRDWHPDLRALYAATDSDSLFTANIRTSVPVAPWQSRSVTVLGDAIHLMTPGGGAGANTALRDAALLSRMLGNVSQGDGTLRDAVAAYEHQMRQYGYEAVLKSRERFNDRSLLHRPVAGRATLGLVRLAMRIVNTVPMLKRQVVNETRREFE